MANPEGGFDVSVVLDGSEVELIEGATKVTDLKSDYVDFAGENIADIIRRDAIVHDEKSYEYRGWKVSVIEFE